MHLTQHITQKGKKTAQSKFYGVYRPKMLSFMPHWGTDSLTLQFAFQKQAELIVCLSTLQSTITMPTEVTEAWMFLSSTERLFHTFKWYN